MKTLKFLSAVSLIALVSACGGGNSGSIDVPTNTGTAYGVSYDFKVVNDNITNVQARAFGDTYSIKLMDLDGDGIFTLELSTIKFEYNSNTDNFSWTKSDSANWVDVVQEMDKLHGQNDSSVENISRPDADENTDPYIASRDTAEWGPWIEGEVVSQKTGVTVSNSEPDENGDYLQTTVEHFDLMRTDNRECIVTVVGAVDDPAPTCDGSSIQTIKIGVDSVTTVQFIDGTPETSTDPLMGTVLEGANLTEGVKSSASEITDAIGFSSGTVSDRTGATQVHADGWTGKGSTLVIVDEFWYGNYTKSPWNYPYSGGGVCNTDTYCFGDSVHGEVVSLFAKVTAPGANIVSTTNVNNIENEVKWNDATGDTSPINYDDVDAINFSWGYDAANGANQDQISLGIDVLNDTHTKMPNSVLVVAAGNDGNYAVDEFDAFGHAYAHDSVSNSGNTAIGLDKTIFVGSIDYDNNLQPYSQTAGLLEDDFIVTYDSLVNEGDAGGTSFAAPVVTGAVGLVTQKFPELTPQQKKTLILHTADDLGAAGVDSIYGHGALNLTNALSPIGNLH